MAGTASPKRLAARLELIAVFDAEEDRRVLTLAPSRRESTCPRHLRARGEASRRVIQLSNATATQG